MYLFFIVLPLLGSSDDKANSLSGGPMLPSKVITTGYVNPYGGAPVTGLTNLLYEVYASHEHPACNEKRKVFIALLPVMLLSLNIHFSLDSTAFLASELNRIQKTLLFKRLFEVSDAP